MLRRALGAGVACTLPHVLRAAGPQALIHVTPDEASRIPRDFIGLSYETSQLSHPQFFHEDNHDLIRYFRTLGDHGVLRLGGNMSEFTVWDPTASMASPPGETEAPDPGFGSDRVFPITPHAIDTLVGFLDATGWRLIYGLNLARGTIADVVAEAARVVTAAGDRLIALQFGNEPDLFKHQATKQKWTYEEFLSRWNELYAAVRARLPDAPIAGPDTSNPTWNARFAQDTGHKVVLQTSHYYAEGPPSDPRMNIDYLLHPGVRLQSYITQSIDVARSAATPYRMAEGNTCYAAGKAGVSDTFASALWVIDFMLAVALAGASGVNIHGGGDGLYTPIAGSPRTGFTARPIYYGMLMMTPLLGSTLLRTRVEGATGNIVAYAARAEKTIRILVINRDAHAVSCELILPSPVRPGSATLQRLEAPSISSTAGVTLAHATVTPHGKFRPARSENLLSSQGRATLHLSPYSAALVTVAEAL